jgi:hypothetical protein
MKLHLLLATAILSTAVAENQTESTATSAQYNSSSGAASSQGSIAPGTILYVLKRFTVKTDDGLQGFPVGKKVTLVRQELSDYVVTDGTLEGHASIDSFTTESSSAAKQEKTETENQNALIRKQARSQALTERFSPFVKEIKSLKEHQLNNPTRLFQTGSSKADVDLFKKEIAEQIDNLETRLKTLQALITEIDARGASFEHTQRLLDSVYGRKVFVGMPKAFVLLSWGVPDDINRTMNENGTSEQWVYRHGRFDGQYVYIEGDKVTSMQD